MAIIELNDVIYRYVTPYHTVEALRGVSGAFETGRFYVLRGSSGSGKTTLLSLMAGLDLPTSGEILYDGTATKRLNANKHRREHVATIYQSFNLLPQLTVAENVMYPMELNGVKPRKAREKALELVQTVGLTEKEFTRFPHMLSGGQQQRVAIARALGTPAKVILADEPTGNLDLENSGLVTSLLKGLAHDSGYCVIVATHDEAVSAQADTVWVITDGKVSE
ncbi:MAG: ABC transporter ATP-binding protein, partial [Oscillospiraceae bacterium]|nr:ABC transporter ATP-binding protein [Oscillospiraceae bacterium]